MGRYFTATVGVSLFVCYLQQYINCTIQVQNCSLSIFEQHLIYFQIVLYLFRIVPYLFPNSTLSISEQYLIYFQIVLYLFPKSLLSSFIPTFFHFPLLQLTRKICFVPMVVICSALPVVIKKGRLTTWERRPFRQLQIYSFSLRATISSLLPNVLLWQHYRIRYVLHRCLRQAEIHLW